MNFNIIIIYFLLINIISFIAIRYDKSLAKSNMWRVSEKTLHLLTLFGGFIGSSLGMKIYRHKTRKVSYLLVHTAIIILWILSSVAFFNYKITI